MAIPWKQPVLSDHFDGKKFHNVLPTPMLAAGASWWDVILGRFRRPRGVVPPAPLPFVVTDLSALPSGDIVIVWFGHSSYLIHWQGKNILVDPVFSGHASPFSFLIRAFPGADWYKPGDMPPIDLLLITHDHYDHLDKNSIAALKPNIRSICTSLGVGREIAPYGFPETMITELDWGQTTEPLPDIRLTATPARHFSGRGLLRDRSLWSSFVLSLGESRLFLGGDSGYGPHFAEIGASFGPFDLAVVECGQYSKYWPLIHMMPEETAQAAVDLKAAGLLPVHWGKFELADHVWNEPARRVSAAASRLGIPVMLPRIGEPVVVGGALPEGRWWEQEG